MGWFWGSSGDASSKDKDPLSSLDPALKKFLEKESPIKYSSSNPDNSTTQPPTSETASTYREKVIPPSTTSDPSSSSAPQPPKNVPTLFPDGRYKDIWKTYRPLAELEEEGKSDQERLGDVLEGFKHRRAEIGRAALENCANEQWAVSDCYTNGSWKSVMTLCRTENRQLERCYLMQAKFLKALGYLSTFDRPPEVDEKIQMHADKLYHQMLDREAATEKAKAEGLPLPSFEPLLSSSKTQPFSTTTDTILPSTEPSSVGATAATKPPTTIDQLKPKVKAKLKKQLDTLSPEEREIEEKAIQAEIAAGERIGRRLGQLYEERDEAARKRREEGKQTFGDIIIRLFRW
ncbi:MAG: hypothetical protein M4579_000156 [Chaenotheca gracillima]|nr:MAG: hypothetical protein M4579_000156 [Chaenotheca gracillima]